MNNFTVFVPDQFKELLTALSNNKEQKSNINDEYKINIELNDFMLKNEFLKSNQNPVKHDLNTTSDTNGPHDPKGAALYVIVVIVWYFLGVVAFVTWQMRRKKTPHDYKTELLSQGLEDQVRRKQIFEELRNPKMRKWAWSIYARNSSRMSFKPVNVNVKYEKEVMANLNKRLIRIEKEKLKFHDDYSNGDSSSPVDSQILNEKSYALNNKNQAGLFSKLREKRSSSNLNRKKEEKLKPLNKIEKARKVRIIRTSLHSHSSPMFLRPNYTSYNKDVEVQFNLSTLSEKEDKSMDDNDTNV